MFGFIKEKLALRQPHLSLKESSLSQRQRPVAAPKPSIPALLLMPKESKPRPFNDPSSHL